MGMKKKFCPKCGREADKIFDGMCVDCLFEKKRTIKIPSKIIVKKCKRCGKYFLGKIKSERIEDIVDPEIKKILNSAKLAESGIKYMNYRVADGKVHLSLKFDFNGIQKSEEHEIEIEEKMKTCQYCAMSGTRYYNAILQIRAPEEIIDEALKEVIKRVAEMKSDNLAFISDIKKQRSGVDVYIGSKAAARKAARALKSRFNARLKVTREMGGKKMGKQVYRDTILILIE